MGLEHWLTAALLWLPAKKNNKVSAKTIILFQMCLSASL